MTDILDQNGLTLSTLSQLVASLTARMNSTYGTDINVDSNSPDGQMIGIVSQLGIDLREFIASVNASFDPDQAIGTILDQRVALNHITRKGGTYTVQPITIVVSQTVSLQGLDANYSNPNGTGFTVQDANGNKFILADSATLTAGTYSKNFRAEKVGYVTVPINTVTVPVTIVQGVTSVNNPSAAISIGQNEETDAQLRTRRARSVALASTGYLNGLEGAVGNLKDVVVARAYENRTGDVDADGIPAHGIWLIVDGGANADIANVLYQKKSYGAPMKGSVVVPITTPSGTAFLAAFDRPSAANLYVQFVIKQTVTGFAFDLLGIKNTILSLLSYGMGDFAETSAITAAAAVAIANQGGGGVPVLVQISSDGVGWTDYLNAPTKDAVWTLSTARISITVL